MIRNKIKKKEEVTGRKRCRGKKRGRKRKKMVNTEKKRVNKNAKKILKRKMVKEKKGRTGITRRT